MTDLDEYVAARVFADTFITLANAQVPMENALLEATHRAMIAREQWRDYVAGKTLEMRPVEDFEVRE